MNQTIKTAGAVVAGVALFGFALYLVKRLPDNAATAPLKKIAAIASGCAA
mgnify:FL=1